MPAQRGSKTLVMVDLGNGIKYGWNTGSVEAELGHTVVPAEYPAGLVIGANSPKPGRATKKTANGTKSSFCAPSSVTSARQANWKVSRGRRRVPSSTGLSKAVYVEVGGIKYAWNMPTVNYAQIQLEQLGIKDATANDVVVYGASYPKPPTVAIVVGAGTANETSYSAFCDPTKLDTLPAGYTKVSDGDYPAPAAGN